MRVGIIGSGEVGTTLAEGFARHGHSVVIGSRLPIKLVEWGQRHPNVRIGTFEIAAEHGEVVVLAVKGPAAIEALEIAGVANFADKTVIDATNPIADAPPVNGVLRVYTSSDESQMERLQKKIPAAHFVKAFSSVGADFMVEPRFKDGPPTMFICGNNADAKKTVSGILEAFGWDVADMGKVEAARAIEPLAILWCIPGILRDEWSHAFKLLRA